MNITEGVQDLLERVGQDTLGRLQIDKPTSGDCTALLTFFSKLNSLLAAAPTPPEQQVADVYHAGTESYYEAILVKKLTEEEVCADQFLGGSEFPDGRDHEGFPGGCERFGHTVETCPTPPAPEVEPVGYVSRMYIDKKLAGGEIHRNGYILDVPVYIHPADDGLRKAAGEAYDWMCGQVDPDNPHLENLRAELEKKS